MNKSTEHERLIKRLLRVDHSGEHGAIAIYNSQISHVSQRYPDLVPWLQEVLEHEHRHREAFFSAMPSRQAKPCRALVVWTTGGAFLGYLSTLLGRYGVMVCTAAVERTVHRHLQEQIAFLSRYDPELAETVKDILREEVEHLKFAEANHDPKSVLSVISGAVISAATEVLIWISTRGDSLRLRAALKAI